MIKTFMFSSSLLSRKCDQKGQRFFEQKGSRDREVRDRERGIEGYKDRAREKETTKHVDGKLFNILQTRYFLKLCSLLFVLLHTTLTMA